MKKFQSTFTLILLIAFLLSCTTPATPTRKPPEPTKDKSVGTINLIFAQVEVGPPNELEFLEGVRNFYNGDGVRVSGGGKGKLDLNDGTRLTLFNATKVSGVSVSVSPKRSEIYLEHEGFMGSVASGGRTTVKLPNGAKITILGTTFFVLYNEANEVATAGNFDGTVLYTLPSGEQQELRPGNMVDIPAGGEVTVTEIPFRPDDFEEAVDRVGTPTGGLATLLPGPIPEPVTQPPVTEPPVRPVFAPILIGPTGYVDVGCPSKTGANIILEWQRPPDPSIISRYELVLEISGNNEFYKNFGTFQINDGYATQFDISPSVNDTMTCTDYGQHYHRWKLQGWDQAGNPGPWSDWAIFRVSNTMVSLSAPQQLSPAPGSVFDHFPRTTTLEWSPVPGAVSYTVEVDCYHCCQVDQWCTDVGQTWDVVPGITTTSYTFDFVGGQPGRWRVWAVGANGQEGPKSGWWDFTYTG